MSTSSHICARSLMRHRHSPWPVGTFLALLCLAPRGAHAGPDSETRAPTTITVGALGVPAWGLALSADIGVARCLSVGAQGGFAWDDHMPFAFSGARVGCRIPLGGPISVRPMAGVVHVWPGLSDTETYTITATDLVSPTVSMSVLAEWGILVVGADAQWIRFGYTRDYTFRPRTPGSATQESRNPLLCSLLVGVRF